MPSVRKGSTRARVTTSTPSVASLARRLSTLEKTQVALIAKIDAVIDRQVEVGAAKLLDGKLKAELAQLKDAIGPVELLQELKNEMRALNASLPDPTGVRARLASIPSGSGIMQDLGARQVNTAAGRALSSSNPRRRKSGLDGE